MSLGVTYESCFSSRLLAARVAGIMRGSRGSSAYYGVLPMETPLRVLLRPIWRPSLRLFAQYALPTSPFLLTAT